MVDEIFDRAYRDSRAQLNASLASGVARLFQSLGNSFKALHRIEWNAPWKHESKRAEIH